MEPRTEDNSGTQERVLSLEEVASTGPESDQEIVSPGTEDDRRGPQGRVLSPEEVAREFLREGADVDRRERKEERRRRRVRILTGFATAAGVVATVAVLVLLAVLALLPSHPPSPPRAALPPPTAVTVEVLSAYQGGALGTIQVSQHLSEIGFVSRYGPAPSMIAAGEPSEIFYGPSGLPAAETLAQWLTGPVTKVSSAHLSGNNLELWIANPQLGGKGNTTTTTTTLSPAHPPPRAP